METGVFIFSAFHDKVFHPNGSVSYESKKIWFYLSEESVNLDTIICTVNVPIVAAAEFARGNWIQVWVLEKWPDYFIHFIYASISGIRHRVGA